MDLLASQIAM